MSEFKQKFNTEIRPVLRNIMKLDNILAVPTLEKVVLSASFGRSMKDSANMNFIFKEMKMISGQVPVIAKAKKSVSSFSVREGMDSSAFVTLRSDRMFDFIYEFVNITLPRVVGFEGLSSKSFDGQGNYNFGLKDHLPFIESTETGFTFGMNVAIVTTADTDYNSKILMQALNFPFKGEVNDVIKKVKGGVNG
ncbi:large ribosomal subunit protein uL5 [Candidatus Nesciobacter abundans]|uniref:Large ribosomal subunit protein uL5 n=1 Tax=Candidatus Nesciobacter abundans TaxID=2601668 RepID=A0A5C0UH78_9PROT|nr:50S ribosomal protein L5 [Candidatus Nesciobacter abundans]QEK38913.1 50S ribosomal protein L5 [Candidatus Nesciobacter abundans]